MRLAFQGSGVAASAVGEGGIWHASDDRRDALTEHAGRRRADGGVMRFEKWEALGNDYVILDEDELPFELTPAGVRRLCSRHRGIGSDGILLLSRAGRPLGQAAMRVLNTDGSEDEMSGNGACQAALYLRRRGWADDAAVSLLTASGEVSVQLTGVANCVVRLGTATLPPHSFSSDGGAPGALSAYGRTFHFRQVWVGNPQCAIELSDGPLDEAPRRYGEAIATHPVFPGRTNVSFWRRKSDGEIAARIFERGVGETLSSGTGAAGAAVDAVLAGVASPVAVHMPGGCLRVSVDRHLDVRLSGSAARVMAGSLSDELVADLASTAERAAEL